MIDVLVLGWAGGVAPTPMRVALGQAATIYYFLHFLVILPIISTFETPLAAAQFDFIVGASRRGCRKRRRWRSDQARARAPRRAK